MIVRWWMGMRRNGSWLKGGRSTDQDQKGRTGETDIMQFDNSEGPGVPGWSSYSAGQVKSGQHLGGAEPDYELAGYAVALPKLLGPVWPHITRGDHGRDAEEFARILRQLGFTLHLHEGVWRFLQVRAQRDPRIASQRPGLGGFVEGVEDDAAVLDDEPDWRHQRPTVHAHVGELARSCTHGEKRVYLRIGNRCHTAPFSST